MGVRKTRRYLEWMRRAWFVSVVRVKDFFRAQGRGAEKNGLKDKRLVGFHAEISSPTVITAKAGSLTIWRLF
jgi:hypothetical protein